MVRYQETATTPETSADAALDAMPAKDAKASLKGKSYEEQAAALSPNASARNGNLRDRLPANVRAIFSGGARLRTSPGPAGWGPWRAYDLDGGQPYFDSRGKYPALDAYFARPCLLASGQASMRRFMSRLDREAAIRDNRGKLTGDLRASLADHLTGPTVFRGLDGAGQTFAVAMQGGVGTNNLDALKTALATGFVSSDVFNDITSGTFRFHGSVAAAGGGLAVENLVGLDAAVGAVPWGELFA